MPDFTAVLNRFAADVLEPGEQILAAFRGRAHDTGTDGGRNAEIYVGRVGSVLGPKIPQPRPPIDPRTGLPSLPPVLALGLTDRRIVVFSRGALTGRTRDFVGTIPRERIHRLEAGRARVPWRRDRLTIHLIEGPPLVVEVVRGDTAEPLMTAFRGDA